MTQTIHTAIPIFIAVGLAYGVFYLHGLFLDRQELNRLKRQLKELEEAELEHHKI